MTGGRRSPQWIHNHSMAPDWIFTVVGFRKLAGDALLTPDLASSPLGVQSEVLVPLAEVTVDRRLRGLYGLVIAVVDDGSRHATEHRFDDVEELRPGRQGHQLYQRRMMSTPVRPAVDHGHSVM